MLRLARTNFFKSVILWLCRDIPWMHPYFFSTFLAICLTENIFFSISRRKYPETGYSYSTDRAMQVLAHTLPHSSSEELPLFSAKEREAGRKKWKRVWARKAEEEDKIQKMWLHILVFFQWRPQGHFVRSWESLAEHSIAGMNSSRTHILLIIMLASFIKETATSLAEAMDGLGAS